MKTNYNADIQPFGTAIEYAGIGNPIDIADILTAQQSLLTFMNAICGFGSSDFWIISGIFSDPIHSAYTVDSVNGAIIWMNSKFLFLPAGTSIAIGDYLIDSTTTGVSRLYGDNITTHNKYTLYTASVSSSAPVGYTSPQFTDPGIDDVVRDHSILNIEGIMNEINDTILPNISTIQGQIATLQSQIYAEPSWNNVTALHSWSVGGFFSPPLANARYKKDNFGWVELDGAVLSGSYNTIAFQLPYTIAFERNFSYFDGTNNILINISKTGNVTIGTNLTGTCLSAVSLSGIRFRLD